MGSPWVCSLGAPGRGARVGRQQAKSAKARGSVDFIRSRPRQTAVKIENPVLSIDGAVSDARFRLDREALKAWTATKIGG